ncbi:hypothetical protein HNQ85_001800 [Anoxybacillus calidus]|jgi:hypothetical protein|uniref:Uncharacterized protein n=1 Tax=[Anoxybacillus] calidus TaxID=575178 RepID=A0A7V9Z061_9BACL|nr:hypothetical protein [Anoxybacillus calidus]
MVFDYILTTFFQMWFDMYSENLFLDSFFIFFVIGVYVSAVMEMLSWPKLNVL